MSVCDDDNDLFTSGLATFISSYIRAIVGLLTPLTLLTLLTLTSLTSLTQLTIYIYIYILMHRDTKPANGSLAGIYIYIYP